MTEKVIIIGSGPAGYTAAIYAARAGLKPLMIEGLEPGGQLMTTTEVDNFPGFPNGAQGPELMDYFRQQALRFETRIVSDWITSVDFSQRPFTLKSDANTYQSQAVIISTGASAKWMNIPSETALRGHGVSACATCDAFFYRGLDVMVVGGGDTAMEEAIVLSKVAKHVEVIHRRDKFRASQAMQDRLLSLPNVSVTWNSAIDEIRDISQKKVTSVVLKNLVTGEKVEKKTDGVFLAIGHKPNTEPFVGHIAMHDNGYIKVEAGSTKTSVAGVFAAGDVADHIYRQAITAAGTGCMAALDVQRFLESDL